MLVHAESPARTWARAQRATVDIISRIIAQVLGVCSRGTATLADRAGAVARTTKSIRVTRTGAGRETLEVSTGRLSSGNTGLGTTLGGGWVSAME